VSSLVQEAIHMVVEGSMGSLERGDSGFTDLVPKDLL
jgi:hypothetical protein